MKASQRLIFRVLLILAAIALAAIPFPAHRVETLYSNGLYPWMAEVIKPLTRWWPFPVLDLLLVALALGLPALWIWRVRAAGTGRRWIGASRAAFDTLTLAAVTLCAFELLWGLNYQRLPLTSKLDFDQKRASPQAARALIVSSIIHLNADIAVIQGRPWPPTDQWRASLLQSFQKVLDDLGQRRGFSPVLPRTSLLNPYFDAAGISGFANPFGYEVILDANPFPFESPYLLAHEWAHVAGFADESEATFIGILTCLRSDMPAIRYSGWLELRMDLPRKNSNPDDPWPELAPQIKRDIQAINNRAQKNRNSFIANAQWWLFNHFLKANRVSAGIGSYELGTTLILGTRFTGNWTPTRL